MNGQQFRALLWLRWRLAVNQWTKRGGLGAILAAFLAYLGLVLTIAGVAGGFFVGWKVFSEFPPAEMLLVWDGIAVLVLFLWLIGILSELQRSEWIDLQRLMHLPIPLGGAFLINYAVSHFTFLNVVVAPIIGGVICGLAVGKGWHMALLAWPVIGCFLFLTAWTYYLRGWLMSLMVTERKKRTIIMFVTMGFVVLFQLPNLYLRTQHHGYLTSLLVKQADACLHAEALLPSCVRHTSFCLRSG